MENRKLQKLYKQVDECRFCKKSKNSLQHIHGYGAVRPKFMLILVNPTHRNISSDPKYMGARFPFIGVRQFWRVLADGGLISKKITHDLPLRSFWTKKHTRQIQNELVKNKLFLTNIVKCCYPHSAYPDPAVIKEQLKILKQEIENIRPKFIIAFGGLVFKTLTNKSVKLSDVCSNPQNKIQQKTFRHSQECWNVTEKNIPLLQSFLSNNPLTSPLYKGERGSYNVEKISGLNTPVMPCYFPIGRGNPKKAVLCLRKIHRVLSA